MKYTSLIEKRRQGKALYLASNEASFPPPCFLQAALTAERHNPAHYPEVESESLVAALAGYWDVPGTCVIAGNGSSQILDLVFQFLRAAGAGRVLTGQHCFGLYRAYAVRNGIAVRHFQMPGLGYSREEITAAAAGCDAVVIDNPNNPTGSRLSFRDIERLCGTLDPRTWLIVDEAYGEFHDDASAIRLVSSHPRLIVTRTFSKAFGLAGLRVGYAIAQSRTIRRLESFRSPFANNAIGLALAKTALQHRAFYAHRARQLGAQRLRMRALLEMQGYAVPQSHGNFLCLGLGARADVAARQLEQASGIIVRPLTDFGLPRHFRLTLGLTGEQEQRVSVALAQLAERLTQPAEPY